MYKVLVTTWIDNGVSTVVIEFGNKVEAETAVKQLHKCVPAAGVSRTAELIGGGK